MKKYVKKGVAFIGMRHLFDRNATPKQRNATPFLKKKHYICTMKEILETMPRIELALIIIGMAALMLGIIFVYAMIQTCPKALICHPSAKKPCSKRYA